MCALASHTDFTRRLPLAVANGRPPSQTGGNALSQETSTQTETRDLFQLTERVALITGGSRGIGRSIAEEFARRGASVVITARKPEELEETAAAIRGEGGEVTPVIAH